MPEAENSILRGIFRSDDIDPATGRPMYEVCTRCNYEQHACPGCGHHLLHGQDCCDTCAEEVRNGTR